ncbi:MAG: GtrA family protein [Alphaproteobacteria bacterium]|nr:GtrA family protein [Alphaproteobacteria bacterium]
MSSVRIAGLYIAFAIVATIANLGAQRMWLGLYSLDYAIPTAILVGTLVGLVIKYVLDKYFIFQDFRDGLENHSRQFSLYALAGVATTAIFWGFEYTFHLIWQTQQMRELGAVIGLAIGYAIKYRLDQRFVFNTEPERRSKVAT